jgi:hypothetical protein
MSSKLQDETQTDTPVPACISVTHHKQLLSSTPLVPKYKMFWVFNLTTTSKKRHTFRNRGSRFEDETHTE